MSRTLTAADRSALIRLASTLPAGSEERRTILRRLASVEEITVRHPDRNKFFRFVSTVAESNGGNVLRSGHEPRPELGVEAFTVVSVPSSEQRRFMQALVRLMPSGSVHFES